MSERNHKLINKPFGRYSICILLVSCALVLVGGVTAKYINVREGQNVIAAKEFYFTSNLLADTGKEYQLNASATEISFTLGNNEDELRYSEDEISYTVEVDNGATLKILDATEGILENGKVSVDNIKLSGLERGKTYTVTAVGKAGYIKTLKATFKVTDNNENLYKYLDTTNGAYVLLTVWADNLKGNVSVEFPEGLIPDNTDPIMRNVVNYSDASYKAAAFGDEKNYVTEFASYTYRFFKDTAGDISIDDFVVKLTDVSNVEHLADKSTPK